MASPQKRPVMIVAVAALFLAAFVVLCIVRLPLPLRIAVAGADIIAALVLFVAFRQHDSQ